MIGRKPVARCALGMGVVVLASGIPACLSADAFAADADREVAGLLEATRGSTLAGRESWVLQPAPAPTPPPEPPPAPAPALPPSPAAAEPEPAPAAAAATTPDDGAKGADGGLRLDLQRALQIAVTSGRDFLDRREGVYQQGLSLSLARYNFGPLLDSTISALWSDAEGTAGQERLGATLGGKQVLPSGGSFGIAALLNETNTAGAGDAWDSSLQLSLSQPLMRGAGYEVSHESLTQAERDMVYAVRDFELFREDFSIDIANEYFDLLSRRARLANLEQNWKDAQFDRNKADALRQVDRNRDEDVFLARRRVINAESDLLSARTSYEAAVDAFKIRLGLPASTDVALADQQPPWRPVSLDEDSAVAVALHNRLDLISATERLADVERAVRNARDGLRPDVGLTLAYGTTGANGHFVNGAVPDDWAASAGVTVALPLQRQSERNAYRNALIARDKAQRDLQRQRDDIERDVVNRLRELRQVEEQVDLQRQQIAQEQRAVAVTEIRYEAGDVENRDLLDARQSLVDAQNALIDLLARHFIARLTLQRTLGVLFVDDDGMWTE